MQEFTNIHLEGNSCLTLSKAATAAADSASKKSLQRRLFFE
jgi:hypothetical protein